MNKTLLCSSILLLILATLSFTIWKYFAVVSVIMTDFYLALILILSAYRSDKSDVVCPPWIKNFFPSRIIGLLMVVLLVGTLIVSFAGLYYNYRESIYFHGSIETWSDAMYFSFVTFTTLGYGEIYPILPETKKLVMWQLASGMLLLFGVFPLLISRISSFTESDIDQKELLHSNIIQQLDLVKSKVDTLQRDKNAALEEITSLKDDLKTAKD